jgi:CRP/FNR family transcriptional regulator, anaerobic regulatory protein
VSAKPPSPLPPAPALRGTPFIAEHGSDSLLLTSGEREQLMQIGVRIRLPARMVIYREESPAEWVFAITDGCVKCYRDLPSGKRALCAFLFARDLFGLAENGRYTNTVQAVTNVTLYRLPLPELATLLKHDGHLQFKFLSKVTHELRSSQRRAILINRRDAVGRFASFIAMMAKPASAANEPPEVPLPMARSDIADFLGLSLESVSRSATELERSGVVKFENRHLARIVDGARLAKLVAAV